jgi:hypothetical protein
MNKLLHAACDPCGPHHHRGARTIAVRRLASEGDKPERYQIPVINLFEGTLVTPETGRCCCPLSVALAL